VTDEELADQPGRVKTRPDEESESAASEQVFSPKDFRLNLNARLAAAADTPLADAGAALANLDNPAIRKLTWEHVVPDRPASSSSSASSSAASAPLPPPRRVPPPLPPPPVKRGKSKKAPQPVVVDEEVDDDVESLVEEIELEEDAVEEVELEEVAVEDVGAEDVEFDEPENAHEAILRRVRAARPAAQAEENRLSLVPDLVDDDSPIELPPITPSGPVVTYVHDVYAPVLADAQSVYAPVLAESIYIPPVRQTTTVAAVSLVPVDPKQHKRTAKRKPKKSLGGKFMTVLILLGLLAGGALAAKKYLVHQLHQPEWSVDVKPLADEVALTRDLVFKDSVVVTELPVDDYATRLASSITGARTDLAPTWRALGVVNGELDLNMIGRQAMNDSPAFYDPTTKTILVAADLKSYEHLYRFAVRRALASALLDQEYGWAPRVASSSPAVALGIRSTIDGDALAVASSLAASDAPDQLVPELFSFIQGHGNTLGQSQYVAMLAGRAGVTMRPTIVSMGNDPVSVARLEQSTPTSDAFLDAARAAPVTVSPAGTQGMMFWYYVLASRIDDRVAWSAATRWTADTLVASQGSATACVDVTVGAADADGAAVLLAALQSWAAAAPVESTTTVTPADGNRVAIRACDPGAAVTAVIPVKVPVIFGGAAVERALVQAAASAAAGTKVDAACLISAARARGAALSSPADDAPVFVADWQPAYVTANLDLASGCVSASG
jgi:hypothetical protein